MGEAKFVKLAQFPSPTNGIEVNPVAFALVLMFFFFVVVVFFLLLLLKVVDIRDLITAQRDCKGEGHEEIRTS